MTTVEAYCTARAEAECSPTAIARCKVKDTATCVAARKTTCRAAVPQGVKLVARRAEACVKALGEAYADAKLGPDELKSVSLACDSGVFAGPYGARAACTTSVDCDASQGLECLKNYGETTGKCLVVNRVEPAASCAGEADRCPASWYCETTTKVCVASKTSGEKCQPGYVYCAAGLECLGGGPFGGACRELGGTGEACDNDARCASGICEKPSKATVGNCAETLELSPLSNSCVGFGS